MLKSLARVLRPILEGKVVAAGLFGSAARGEAKSGSDIDLMVIVSTTKEYNHVSSLLLEPVHLLSKRYGWHIQQVVYKKKDLRNDARAMTGLLVNVERDWIHIAGEDLHKLRNDLVHGRGK
jgi:predicted nucleotidyltransferase